MRSLVMNTSKLVCFVLCSGVCVSCIYILLFVFLATCYRNAKSFDECRECLMKAADCHMQNRSLFHAAKCFEQVKNTGGLFLAMFSSNIRSNY